MARATFLRKCAWHCSPGRVLRQVGARGIPVSGGRVAGSARHALADKNHLAILDQAFGHAIDWPDSLLSVAAVSASLLEHVVANNASDGNVQYEDIARLSRGDLRRDLLRKIASSASNVGRHCGSKRPSQKQAYADVAEENSSSNM